MPLTRHHIYLFIISLGIITCLVLLAALAEQSVSAEGAVQAAINDPGVRDRIGSNYFAAGEAVTDAPFSAGSAEIAPKEVWVVPVIVHNGTSDEVYHVDVTREGRVCGITGPLHIEYTLAGTVG